MAKWNDRRRRHRAFVALRTLVFLLLGLASAVPLEAAGPADWWIEGAVVTQQTPVHACSHDCVGAILPCGQHGSCSLVALPIFQRDPGGPNADTDPLPLRWTLKLHLPAVLLHPPNRLSL